MRFIKEPFQNFFGILQVETEFSTVFWFGHMNPELCRVFILGEGGIQLVVTWWFGILRRPLGNNPFHNRIPKIQIIKANHQLTISWG